MQAGWSQAGQTIHAIYATQCHQMPDRSFFLFGPQAMYSLSEIQAAWQNTSDPVALRRFIGQPGMGWKVAWSDRMVSMYMTTWLAALAWWPLRQKIKPLPLWGLVLFWLPMAADGTSHMISDMLSGMTSGFRYDNAWLAALTGHSLPDGFHAGNALGSFNSWMRLITGIFFGIGLVWFAFPWVEQSVQQKSNLTAVEKALFRNTQNWINNRASEAHASETQNTRPQEDRS